jgi:TatD DNase family protein
VIDTHCHLDAQRFDSDRDAVLARAHTAGVAGIVLPGIGPENWEPLLALRHDAVKLVAGLGVHPQFLPELDPNDDDARLQLLDRLLARGGAVAVGECGLDGPSAERAPMERQVRVLRGHFELARKHRLPLLVHCLRAQPQLLELLKQEAPVPAGILLHSYSGSNDLVKKYLKYDCHFSFAGPVSFTEARRPLDALRAVPLERLMAETDAPDQAPHPHRGGRSEPAYLPLIVEAMARARGETVEQVAEATTKNAQALFPALR